MDREPESEEDGRLVLPAPTGPPVADTAGPLITEDEEEDTTVEPNEAAMRALAEPPPSLSIPTPDPMPVMAPIAKPPRAVSWPATLAGGLIGFVLGALAVFFVFFSSGFGRRGPAKPAMVTLTPIRVTTLSAPAPAPARIVPAPPAASAPVVEPVPPERHHRQRKVVKLDEVVLTVPD